MDSLSEEDIALLNTSHQQRPYFYKSNIDYVNEFIHKFDYMRQVGLTNQSAECMAIFLSSFTRPVWTPVDCNVAFQHNYFICERNRSINVHQHSYTHSQMACLAPYTYVHESCWKMSVVSRRGNSYVNTTKSSMKTVMGLSKLFGYLSAWSLGQATRVQVMVRFKDSHNKTCLRTNDFNHQRYKDWYEVSNCDTTYSLVERKTLIYSNTCKGTHLTIYISANVRKQLNKTFR